MRARIVRHVHARDNIISGTAEIDGKSYTYSSRGHIAKAVNRLYREVSWKPQEGDEIVIDGEVTGECLIIDHLEPWDPGRFNPLDRHQDLQERLLAKLPKMPSVGKHLRHSSHSDEGIQVSYLRWTAPVETQIGRKKVPVIVSAIAAEGELRFAFLAQHGASRVAANQVPFLPVLAESLGIPSIAAPRQATPASSRPQHVSKEARRDPNKWRPGVPYRPEGMPEPEPEFDIPFDHQPGLSANQLPADDCPF